MSDQPTRQLSRRSFLQMVSAGGAVMALAACTVPVAPAGAPAGQAGAGSAAASEQAFLNYWTGWSGFEFDELQKMVDKFNEANTDKVFVNMTTVFGQYEKVLTAIAGGNPPDVVSAVWLHELVSMASRGGLQPITQYAQTAGIDGSEYFPQFWDAWQYNGDLWGMMITSNSNVIAYQPALFEEVGATAPQSIAELDAVAMKLEKMDANGNIERVGLIPSGLTWWGRVFGGSFYDADAQKITANDPNVVAALDWENTYRQRLSPEKVAAFQSGFGDFMSTQNSFFVSKEGMTQVGEWFIQFQKKFAPDLVMEFMPAPYPEGGNDNTTTFDGSVFTIPTGAKTPDASWEFVRWLSEPQNMGDFCFNIQNVPPKLAPASEDRFVSDPRFQLAVDLLSGPHAFGPDKMPVNSLLYSRLAEAESAVFNGQMSAQEALDQVTTEVQAELDKVLQRGS
ncbi:MAG: extracellular solute-binding protein [Caldilinea sp.]|nr:extracellular solute-binding protein [Anaerolineales bacterium]HRA65691.1 extracellular solute-binding protein [Caldilinea sp.]